jgi:hypothetical protein
MLPVSDILIRRGTELISDRLQPRGRPKTEWLSLPVLILTALAFGLGMLWVSQNKYQTQQPLKLTETRLTTPSPMLFRLWLPLRTRARVAIYALIAKASTISPT